MNRRTVLIGSIVFIVVLVLKAVTTVPKAEQREECENVLLKKLQCPVSLEAAVGDDLTLDFHLEPRCDVTQWKGFVFECEQNSDNVLVYKSRGFYDEDQAKRFSGRVSSDSSWEPSKGKLTWKITQFGERDAGTYRCFVRTRDLSCSTELKIKQVEDQGKLNKAQYPIDVAVTLVLAALALLCLLI